MRIPTSVLIAVTALAVSGLAWQWLERPAGSRAPRIETVIVPAGSIDYRPPGEYLSDGKPITPASRSAEFGRPIEIMKFQVSAADYTHCVDDGVCEPLDKGTPNAATLPVTGVNYFDAIAFAAWLSDHTGETWRLPTDAEWSYAAAEKYGGDIFTGDEDADNPARAWIRRYREQAALRRRPEPYPRPAGGYGENRFGVSDMSGNVWEWTSDCYARVAVEPETNETVRRVENCGVHVLGGRHRAYISEFIRDGQSGGCAAGLPPDNLGFRLVREPRNGLARLWDHIRNAVGRRA